MFLKLQNIRCYTDKTFNLPDEGIVLLHGTSGIGKTSILKAIYFALYGKEGKIIKYKERKCSVELHFRDIKIVRTKNPNHLSLEYQGVTYEQEAAQAIINKLYGNNFNITSYVAQKSIESFIDLTTAKKIEFFNSLAIKDVDILSLKEKTKGIMKTRKETLTVKSNEIRVLRSQLESFNLPEELEYPLKSGSFNQDEIDKERRNNRLNYDKLTALYKEQKFILGEIEKLNKSKEIYDQNQLQIRLFSEQLDTTKKELESITEDDLDYNTVYKIITKYILYLETKIEYENEKQDLNTYTRDILNKYNTEIKELENSINNLKFDSDYYEKIKYIQNNTKLLKSIMDDLIITRIALKDYNSKFIKNKLNTLKSELEILEKSISEIESKLFNNKNSLKMLQKDKYHKCPSCSSGLILTEDCIKIYDVATNMQQRKLINNQIEQLNDELTNKKAEKDKLVNDIKILERLEYNVDNRFITMYYELCNSLDFTSEYQKLKEQADVYEQNTNKVNGIKQTIENINKGSENSIVLKRNKLSKIKTRYDSIKTEKINLFKRDSEVDILNKLLLEYDNEFETIKSLDDLDEFDEADIKDVLTGIIKIMDVKMSNSNTTRQTKSKLQNKITELEGKIIELNKVEYSSDTIDNLIERKEEIVEAINEREKKKTVYDKREKKLERYLANYNEINRYNKLKSDIEVCEREEQAYIKSLNVSEKFLKILTEAETISISNTLENINMSIKYYMDHFFPEGNMQMALTPFKENKKGDKQTGLDVEIYYNGEKTDLECLSGGEYDRCLLILFLSFNSMVEGDLIMLDECLSSLNGELVEEIIDILKNTLKGKLVLVTLHQANVGIFDQVLNL